MRNILTDNINIQENVDSKILLMKEAIIIKAEVNKIPFSQESGLTTVDTLHQSRRPLRHEHMMIKR